MSTSRKRKALAKSRRIVVKVGSSTLTRDGLLRTRKVSDLVRQISVLTERGIEVVLVSSGAIAVGRFELGWTGAERSLREQQAAAAVGQIGLTELYRRRFARRDKKVGQVLLTRSGLEDRERFLNARHTLLELLRLGVVPIVNENDTVATEEIVFGDNDKLSATIVNLVDADLLVVLTAVDGLYERPPQEGEAAPNLVKEIERVTPALRRSAGAALSGTGRGGMVTKLEAAEMAARCGATTVICHGGAQDVLLRVQRGEEIGTLVHASEPMGDHQHWLAFTTRSRGEIVVDPQQRETLTKKRGHVLAARVKEVRGRFRVGDTVTCVDRRGREIARGLVSYGATDLARIAGLSKREARRVLGYWNGEVIHRDDLVLLEN